MTNPMRLVIDANILVSAYAHRGTIHDAWRQGIGPHECIISPEIFQEVERNLRQADFHLSDEQVRRCLLDILERCRVERPKHTFDGTITDENDRHLAALFVHCEADYVVTGEENLHSLSHPDVKFISISNVIRKLDHSRI